MELMLEKFCGSKDVVTPIKEERNNEVVKRSRNYLVPIWYYRYRDFYQAKRRKKPARFGGHNTALYIKQRIPKKIWDSYYKFCFERHPYDRYISAYYFDKLKFPNMTIDEFVDQCYKRKAHHEIYCINNEIAVDKVYKYEDLDAALIDISAKCGLPPLTHFSAFKAKAQHRKDRRPYYDVLDQRLIDRINEKERRTFELMDYDFHVPNESNQ